MDKKHQTRSLNFYNVYDKKFIKKKTNLNTVERMKNVSDKNHQTLKNHEYRHRDYGLVNTFSILS